MASISMTMPSGLDTNSLVQQLVELEQLKVTSIQNKKNSDQLKIDAYSKMRSMLMDLKNKANDLSTSSSFDLFKSSSTKPESVTIKGTSGSVDGQYDVNVYQLASNEKMISADNRITDQKATLASQGITIGEISIDGVSITIDDDDSIQDLRAKINTATKSSGNRINVQASVVKMADDNYRLVLAAKTPGSAGIEYKDISGSALQDLGIITDADGAKGTYKQVLQSSEDLISSWTAIATGTVVKFGGKDHNGNDVSGVFLKSEGATIQEFQEKIKAAYHGSVDVSTDANGHLIVTDKTGGISKLSMDSITFGGTEHALTVAQNGMEGRGVLALGKDAFFMSEGMSMQSSSNTIEGFIPGTTFELHALAVGEPVTVGLSQDIEGITAKVKSLIASFNTLSSWAKDATKIASGAASRADGDLRGDMTVPNLINSLKGIFRKQYDLLDSGVANFAMVGMKTDSKTGEVSLDEKRFKEACERDIQAVENLFITVGASENPNVILGRNTRMTTSAKYVIEEIDDDYSRIRLAKDGSGWFTSEKRTGDVIAFLKGPAAGLSVTSAKGSIGSGGSSFTLSKGISANISDLITTLTDAVSGVVALRQTTIEASMKSTDKRIEAMQLRVDAYRTRLIKQFSSMESSIANIKQQSSSLTSFSTTGK